ncbi:MAG: hypothetical protein JW741_01820 [Sedimentisphaerales bacterium]|nr:hypothetical protein [Sedimentisphaerales bacterium]
MTFTDYPGHFVAATLVLLFAVLTFVSHNAAEMRRPERKLHRRLLMATQWAVILVLLLIAWNPSTWQESKVFAQNAVLTLFDTSESMSVADDRRQTRLDKALDRFAKHLRRGGSEGPKHIVYGFDRYPYHCGSADLLRRWGSETDLQSVLSLLAQYSGPGPVAQDEPDIAGEAKEKSVANEARQADTERLAGVVIFTDGQAGDKTLQTYHSFLPEDSPIVLVGVGSRRRATDIAVTSIVAPARVWIDNAYKVGASLTATNLPAGSVLVELLEDGQVIDALEVDRDSFAPRDSRASSGESGHSEATVEFAVPAHRLGAHVLSVRARSHAGEINVANNSRSTCVEVTQEQPLHVLLYCQQASFDIGKIRQALAWDKRVDLALGFDVIRDPTISQRVSAGLGHTALPRNAEEFGAYDVIVLGSCDLTRLAPAQLEGLYRFVADRGGGLLLLPGQTVATLAAWGDEKSAALLPVLLDRGQERIWPPVPDAIDVTFEAEVSRILDPEPFKDRAESLAPYYGIAAVKPASLTFATVQDVPLVSAHRLGRGRVCLLNASKLFTLYREDEQGGLLSELITRLVAYLGRTPARGAGMELFVQRAGEDPRRVVFSAYVVDKAFRPVPGANVLLTVEDKITRMEAVGQGRYRADVDWGAAQSVVATVQAENGGLFLGERTMATTLPPVRDEMSEVDLDEEFLEALAQRLGGRYVHIDEVDDGIGAAFVPRRQTGTTEKIQSVWPMWPLLLTLCLLLSVQWFVRRAVGLV